MDKRDFITQVISCTKILYARYRGSDGKCFDCPVYYLALCADGCIRPLDVNVDVCFADDASNYVGLYSESNDEIEHQQEEWGD